ncbi:MAG: DinB family protein [Phycisphaerae bacterium]
MTMQEVLVKSLETSAQMLNMTLADFSEADMLVRPVPNANHALWQLGHLTVSEAQMLAEQGAKMPELPAGFAERFTAKTAAINEASKFGTKAELLAVFAKVRNASIAFAKSLSAADLDRPTTNEMIKAFAPNTAVLVVMANDHGAMHMGQWQVIRRKLGKPILF